MICDEMSHMYFILILFLHNSPKTHTFKYITIIPFCSTHKDNFANNLFTINCNRKLKLK